MQQNAIDKALTVLESLETTTGRRSLAEIAEAASVPKATAHRLLATLERRGYVRRLPSREYALGQKLVALGVFAGGKDPLITVARPVLDELVNACGETVQLGVLQGSELLYVERREPENAAVRLAAQPAPLGTLHASAAGKVLLAFSAPELFQRVVARGLTQFTDATIVSPEKLRKELSVIRHQDFALSVKERHDDVFGVAVPVRSRSGAVIAAITAAGPIHRMSDQKVAHLRECLVTASRTIGAACH